MKLISEIEKLLEGKITIVLDNKEFQLNVQNAIKALIKYEFDNPDMGNLDDFRDDKDRLNKLTKEIKGLNVATVKSQIELLVNDDELSVEELLKSKVIV